MATYDFGEQKTEKVKGEELEVWQSPKYRESKQKAIEIIESERYKGHVNQGDFWILKNRTRSGKMAYTGLIISHNGCLKINDLLDEKDRFKAQYLKREKVDESLIYEYNDGELYEVGEVSKTNCQNDYPYAMAFKRCFDRVVLKKSKLAFAGIYSDSEADEFKENIDSPAEEIKERFQTISDEQWKSLKRMYSMEEIKATYKEIGITRGSDMPLDFFKKKENEFYEKFKAENPEKPFY